MDCMFCNKELIKKEKIIRNKICVFLSSTGYNPKGVLEGVGVIIPLAHKETPFDLSEEEVADYI